MRLDVILLVFTAFLSTTQSISQVSNVKEAAAFATATSSKGGWLAPIIIKGNKFFDSKTGNEFRLKGMAYYPRPNGGKYATESNVDWFTDEHEAIWKPDLAVMKDLGVNTIRLYSVDPSQSHDKFMCAAAQAGMYVIVGMVAPCENCAILDLLPPKCYPDELFTRMQMVYNAFAVYDNTLGFSIANENNLLRSKMPGGGQTMPCAKALLRDTRNYASSCSGSLRDIPIGIDLADIPLREQWLQYMDCAIDDNEFTRSEWIGFNPYVECDPILHPTYKDADGLIKMMKEYDAVQYGRPVMFGEFGCVLGKNTVDGYENQRAFNDAKWMNTEPDMMKEIVGGNVFEFVTEVPNTVSKVPASKTQKADNGRYGVGYYSPDDCDHETIPCVFKPYPEYANLKKAYTTTPASTLTLDSYTVDRTKILDCPSNISTTLQAMPKVKPLSCSTAMPVCNGMKSNNGNKSPNTTPALGEKAPPSNTDPITKSNGKQASEKSSSTLPSLMTAMTATALSVVIAFVL